MATNARYVEEVRRIVLESLKGYEVDVYFFGSRAWGTEHRYSDVDVGVVKRERVPAERWMAMMERLEECAVPYEVDVVDLDDAPVGLREKVLERGIRWNG
jgi:predicted nucleotidyltransferase